MIIENCPKCKGTHIGSYECPIFCICCASGNDLPEGEECKACGRIGRPIHVNPVGLCEPWGGMLCRKAHPGASACTRYGGKAVCLEDHREGEREAP